MIECPNSLVAFFPPAIYRNVGSSSVLPELLRSVRKETLNTVQFLRNGAVRLTFKSSADCDRTLASGTRYGEVPLRVVSVETRSRLVYLRDCPSEVPEDVVKRFFASFGEVHSVSCSSHQGFPGLLDGNRVIKVSLTKDVPAMVTIAGFECRVWYRRQPAFCVICEKLGHRTKACPMDGLCRRCRKPGHLARECRDAWAAPRPDAPAADASADAGSREPPASSAVPSGSASVEDAMDEDYVPPTGGDVDSEFEAEMLSGDEEVIAAAPPPLSPRRRRKRKHRAESPAQKCFRESVDMDTSTDKGPNHRLFRTFREVWEDKLTWEEIRARKCRADPSVSQEPSSTPELFSEPSSDSDCTPVPPETPDPSPFSSDGSVVDSVVLSPRLTSSRR